MGDRCLGMAAEGAGVTRPASGQRNRRETEWARPASGGPRVSCQCMAAERAGMMRSASSRHDSKESG